MTWSVPGRMQLPFSDNGNKYPQNSNESDPDRVVQISAGDLHSAVLTRTGKLFLAGNGPCVPYFLPVSQKLMDDDEDNNNNNENNNNKHNNNKKDDKDEFGLECLVSTPR